MRARFAVVFSAGLLGSLTACSPYSFPKEVAAFGTGVDQLSDGFTAGYAGLAADRSALLQLDLTTSRTKVAMASSCRVAVSALPESKVPCDLYPFGSDAPTLSRVEQSRATTMVAVAALKDYAKALTAITNAADRTAYDAAVSQLSGSVGALAKTADPAAPGASAVAPAVVNIVGWLAGTALDQQRFEGLKAGITAAGTPGANGATPIATVAKTLGGGLEALSLERQAVLNKEAEILVNGLGPSLSDADYRQELSNAQGVVTVLDGLRQANPAAAADGLVKAHDALVAAVNNPSRDYPSLLKALSDFSDKASALDTALAAKSTTQSSSTTAKKGQ